MEAIMSTFILPLESPESTLQTVGGKGMSLALLSRAGFPVPCGFHVTTEAYRRLVADNGLQARILVALEGCETARPESIESASRRIGDLFAAAPIPPEIVSAVVSAYAGLDGVPVAVRSSATAEDLPEASFAGQQDTYLNVRGEEAVLAAIRRCWASLWTARAIGYRLGRGVLQEGVALAVVVQELVEAEAAGIMFTADPLTGSRDRVTINAAWGLGEAVAGGKVSPDTFIVGKITGKVIDRKIGRKEKMTALVEGGTREEPVPAGLSAKAVLGPARAVGLGRLGLRVEELYGRPMDIEWALRRGRFFLLQARPITALHGHDPEAGEWNDSLAGDYLWSRANYGEAVPDVMTPCTWSLVRIFIDNADPSVPSLGLRHFGNIGGRLYVNLSEAASIAAAFGVSPRRFARMVEVGFGRVPEGIGIPIVRLPLRRVLVKALPVAVRTLSRMRANLKRMPTFLAGAPSRCDALKAGIKAASGPAELAALWQAEVEPFLLECSRMVEAAANQGGAAIITIGSRLRKLVGEEDANALLSGQGSGSYQLASLGPLLALTRLAKGEIERADFARQFGHRGPHELEVSAPRPAEEPDWIDRQAADLRKARQEAGELLARQENARAAAWERLRARHPRNEKSTRRRIDRWAAIARDREATRSEAVRAFWALRVFVLRAGGMLGIGEGVFFLVIDEILAALEGDRASLSRIASRRAAYERYRALPTYPVLIRGQFDPFKWAEDPQRRSDVFDALGGGAGLVSGGAITGFAGSAGVVEGRARVLESFEAGDRLLAGEILVTTLTNVGWTPLFPRAAAIVTDVGAPLSHAAIIARELGIPAVVGCGDATMRLKTGDLVRVDGNKGTVEILEH
jgi:pyruvate,water dikinase